MKNWKGSLKATIAGAGAGAAIGLPAFFFLTSHQYPSMRAGKFLLVPALAGFTVAMVARGTNIMVASCLLSVAGPLVLLIALGKEGVLCAVLALPIIAAALAGGVGLGIVVRSVLADRAKNRNATTGMLVLLAPTLILVGERIETPMLRQPRIEIVQTAVEVSNPPERVWGNIVSIDSIQASKPLLMYVGLPTPQRCTLQGRGVGAKRTCYFNVGYIEETVTEWNPPYFMGLSIDRTHMPGAYWLKFEAAEYRLEPHGTGTVVTRRTTVSSYLHPSWYWRRFERLGVESEHGYILRDLALRATATKNR